MKKVVIMTLSCNKQFFMDEENVVRKTYAKRIIEGTGPENVKFYSYTASDDGKFHVNKNLHILKVPTGDDIYSTFDKTTEAFRLLNEIDGDYDYVFKTNLSTWINVELLSRFVDSIPDEDSKTIFANMVYCTNEVSGPEPYDLYAIGHGELIPKFWVDKLVECEDVQDYIKLDRSADISNYSKDKHELDFHIDDCGIGLVVNILCEQYGYDKKEMWKNFKTCEHVPNIQFIKNGEMMKYIVSPVRQYVKSEKERLIEYKLLQIIQQNADKLKIEEDDDLFRKMTAEQTVNLISYTQGKSLKVSKSNLDKMIEIIYKCNHSIEKSVEFINTKSL